MNSSTSQNIIIQTIILETSPSLGIVFCLLSTTERNPLLKLETRKVHKNRRSDHTILQF